MIDVIVAGGGPAGLVSALYARRAGLDVLVVEPRDGSVGKPIDKACGEGLMPGALTALEELGMDPDGHALAGIRYLDARAGAGTATVAEARFGHGAGRGVRRTVLHTALRAAAERAGVGFLAERVVDVRQSAADVTVDGRRARYLIAADGLHSPIRAQLGLSGPGTRARRWGVRAHFAVAPWSDCVDVHWGRYSEAYVTPVGEQLVGIAVLSSRAEPFIAALRNFPAVTDRLAGAAPVEPPRGAGPLRQRVLSPAAGRVLLVGDAAGYIDALTGEGLAVAFAAARAAVAAIAADQPQRYARDWRRASRRPRQITEALLWASGRPLLRRAIVPAASGLPGLFTAAVGQLAR